MCLLTLAEKADLEQTETTSTLKTMIVQEVSLSKKVTKLSPSNNMLYAPVVKQMDIFRERNVFPQIS
jgi:hypothetical protein